MAAELAKRTGLDTDSAAALLAAADGDAETALAIHVGYNGGDIASACGDDGGLAALADAEATKRGQSYDLETARATAAAASDAGAVGNHHRTVLDPEPEPDLASTGDTEQQQLAQQLQAKTQLGQMLDEMVVDGHISTERRNWMAAYVDKATAEHNSGIEAAWYEAMSFQDQEGSGMFSAKGSPPAALLEEAEDEFGAHFGVEVAARLRQCELAWGSSAVGGGGSEEEKREITDPSFSIGGAPFSLWCDDEHLGDTLADDPTGTTVWNCGMVLAKALEVSQYALGAMEGRGRGGVGAPAAAEGGLGGVPKVQGCRVLELGCGVGLAGLAAARLGAAAVMFTDGHKGTLDLLALNIVTERRRWQRDSGGSKDDGGGSTAPPRLDLNMWEWCKPPSRRMLKWAAAEAATPADASAVAAAASSDVGREDGGGVGVGGAVRRRRGQPSRDGGGGGGRPYEVILGADLVYAATPLPATGHLAHAIAQALAAPHGVALIALERRPDSEVERQAFLAALAESGLRSTVVELPLAIVGPDVCTSKVEIHRIQHATTRPTGDD